MRLPRPLMLERRSGRRPLKAAPAQIAYSMQLVPKRTVIEISFVLQLLGQLG